NRTLREEFVAMHSEPIMANFFKEQLLATGVALPSPPRPGPSISVRCWNHRISLREGFRLNQIHACSSGNMLVFSGSMLVFPETRLSFSEPFLVFRKQACLFRNHACFSRNRRVHFGTMHVFPETGM